MLNALLLFMGLGLGMQSTGVDPAGQEAGTEPVSQMITAEYPISSLGWVLDEISKESGLRIRPGGEAEKHYLAIKVEDVEVTDLLEQIAYVTESRWEMEDEIWLLRPDEAVRAESRARAVAARKEVLDKLLRGIERGGVAPTRVHGYSGQGDVEDFYKAMQHMDLERVASAPIEDYLYFSDRPNARQLQLPEEAAKELSNAVQNHNDLAVGLEQTHIRGGRLSTNAELESALAIIPDYMPRVVDMDEDKLVITIQRYDFRSRSWTDSIYSFQVGFYDSEGEFVFGAAGSLEPSQNLVYEDVNRSMHQEPYLRLSKKYYSDIERYRSEFLQGVHSNELLELRARPLIDAIRNVSENNLIANVSDAAFNMNVPIRTPNSNEIDFQLAYRDISAHHSIDEEGGFIRIKPLDSHSARENRFDRRIVERLAALDSLDSVTALDMMSQIALENPYLPANMLTNMVRPNELGHQLYNNRHWLAFYGSLNQVQRRLLFTSRSLNAGSLSPQSKELLLRIADSSRNSKARMDISKLRSDPVVETFFIWRTSRVGSTSNWNASEKLPNGVTNASIIYLDSTTRNAAFVREPHPSGTGHFYSSFDVPAVADQLHRLDRKAAGLSFAGSDRSESSFVAGQIHSVNMIFEVAPNCVVFGRLVAGEPNRGAAELTWSELPTSLISQARSFMAQMSKFSDEYKVPEGTSNNSPPVQVVPPPMEVR